MSLVEAYDGWVVDLDGVIWVGDRPVPGADRAIARLRAEGKRIVFLTNDPRGSRDAFARRLRTAGVPADPEQVVTSSAALAAFLRHEEGPGRRAYAIGSPALKRELIDAGLVLVDGQDRERIDLVAVGGHEDFDYEELRIAAGGLGAGAELYATNRDPTYPMPDGPRPGTGAILAAVETAAGRRAHVVGKPESSIFRMACSKLSGCRRIAVVGDGLEPDIVGGQRAGLATILVLSGGTSSEDLARTGIQPDHVLADLGALITTDEEHA